MPGKQPRALCPVCQEALPPDETECGNCGAFVIDEAVVRLCRAFGIDRPKALQLFEAGFRHPAQLRGRDPDGVLERKESGLLFLCTNCGGFAATGDSKCPRCGAEFEAEEEAPAWSGEEEDILDLVLCPNCGADNGPEEVECEICGEPLKASASPAAPTRPPDESMEKLDAMLEDLEVSLVRQELPPPDRPAAKPAMHAPAKPSALRPTGPTPAPAPEHKVPPSSHAPSRPMQAHRGPPAPPAPPPPPAVGLPKTAPTTMAIPGPSSEEFRPRVLKRPAEIRRKDARSETPKPNPTRAWKEATPGFVGPAVAGAGIGLALSNALGQGLVSWGLAGILAALAGYGLAPELASRPPRVRGRQAVLLGIGALLGLLVPVVLSLGPPEASGLGLLLAIVSAASFALAARRVLRTPARTVLTAASALPMVGLGVLAGEGVAGASDPAWTAGLLASLLGPALVAFGEARHRLFAQEIRKELIEAEKDYVKEDYAKSVEDYDRAIALTEQGPRPEALPWYGKGAALILLGRYEEALQAIDRALDINPRDEVAWVNKGNALTKLGRLVDALRCFNAAIKVNPRYEVAWNNKGNALARLGRYDEALKCYDRAIAIDPDYRGAWVNKGYVLAKVGRFEEAASCADRVLTLKDRARPGAA